MCGDPGDVRWRYKSLGDPLAEVGLDDLEVQVGVVTPPACD